MAWKRAEQGRQLPPFCWFRLNLSKDSPNSLVRGERIPPASSQSAGTKITERHLPCNVGFASAKRFHVRVPFWHLDLGKSRGHAHWNANSLPSLTNLHPWLPQHPGRPLRVRVAAKPTAREVTWKKGSKGQKDMYYGWYWMVLISFDI